MRRSGPSADFRTPPAPAWHPAPGVDPPPLQLPVLVVLHQVVIRVPRKGQRVEPERVHRRQLRTGRPVRQRHSHQGRASFMSSDRRAPAPPGAAAAFPVSCAPVPRSPVAISFPAVRHPLTGPASAIIQPQPRDAVHGLQMPVRRHEISSSFHGVGCNPHVVGRDGTALRPESSRYPGVAVSGYGANGHEGSVGIVQEGPRPAAFPSNREPFRNP